MILEPSFGGAALAVAAVAAGAPLFGDGFRALRLRRLFARLRERPLDELPSGLTHVRGRVALESPLFSPLSSLPCAGFRLEAAAADGDVQGAVEERRPFRLASRGVRARVLGDCGTWGLRVTEQKRWAPGDPLTENLAARLERIPEWDWLRRRGSEVVLTERALLPNTEVHVVAYARQARPIPGIASVEWLATGTDDETAYATEVVFDEPDPEPELWLGPGEALDFLLVSDEAPKALHRHVPAWRAANALLGPLLGVAGLAYLAYAVDRLRGQG